jgi:hypothetical protein
MQTFGEILAEFKQTEEPENIVPIMDDESLLNGLVAWKSVEVTHKEMQCSETDPAKKWKWLWENTEFNVGEYCAVAGLKQQDVYALLARLKGLRLIYPDGTINTLARQYLGSLVAAKLRKATAGPGRPPKQPEVPQAKS